MKITQQSIRFLCFIVLTITTADGRNISCYQCTRNTVAECDKSDLRPCYEFADRCVIHMKNDPENGFVLKRECGLGPCFFDDDMAVRGLGWGTNCDRSKDNYFCLFCCKENGCNKNGATLSKPSFIIIAVSLLVVILLDIFKGFQPPYLPENPLK